MEQQQFAVKVGHTILPEIYFSVSSAEDKKAALLKETHNSANIKVVPVSSSGQEILFG